MDRKISAVGIQCLESEDYRVAEIGLEEKKITAVNLYTINKKENPHKWENLINKCCGHISLLFPLSRTYISEIEISSATSKKDKDKIIASNAEIVLPCSARDCFVFELLLEQKENQKKYINFFLPKDVIPLRSEIEMQKVEINPGAVYQGLTGLFDLEQEKENIVLIKQGQEIEIYWGKNGVMTGVRCFKIIHLDQTEVFLMQILNQYTSIKNFYTFCEPNDEKKLKEIAGRLGLEWKKANGSDLGMAGKDWENDRLLICSAFAHATGYESLSQRISIKKEGLLARSNIQRMLIKMMMIIFFTIALIEVGIIKEARALKKQRNLLASRYQEAFYNIFSSQTPMINPIEQLLQKTEKKDQEEETMSGLKPLQLIEILNTVNQTKPHNVEIDKIIQDGDIVGVEAVGSSKEEINQWLNELQKTNFKQVQLEYTSQEKVNGLLEFRIKINLN